MSQVVKAIRSARGLERYRQKAMLHVSTEKLCFSKFYEQRGSYDVRNTIVKGSQRLEVKKCKMKTKMEPEKL